MHSSEENIPNFYHLPNNTLVTQTKLSSINLTYANISCHSLILYGSQAHSV
jgi:hypothetical protein